MIDLLLIPRPITRILLLSIGIAAGQLLWLFLPVKLIAYVSGLAAPFCLLAASAVWGMREKVDVAFDGDHLSAADFRKARAASNSVRRKAMFRAAWVVCAALLAGSPLVSSQIAGAIWHWMVIAGGVGVAEACYSYLVANHLEEQIRSPRATERNTGRKPSCGSVPTVGQQDLRSENLARAIERAHGIVGGGE